MNVSTATMVAFFALAWQGCGVMQEPPQPHMPRAVNVQQWDMGDAIRQRKATIVQACKEHGADQARTALVLAMAFQETSQIDCASRDCTKDGQGDARNVSAFNMNIFALKLMGCAEQADALNDDANLGQATKILLHGIDQMGEDRFMNLHRGGQKAYEDGVSYGAKEYRDQMRAVQAHIMANPCLFADESRVAGELEHV